MLGFSLIGAALLAAAVVLVLAWPRRYRGRRPVVQVLVLGDVGRSPRMQYHALSLAARAHVVLVGYYESDLLDELDRHPRLTKVRLVPPPAALRRLPFAVGGPLKALWQVADVAAALAYRAAPARWLLVQNPPAIPTLAVAALVAPLRGTRLLVDWHNYGWSILAGVRGPRHPFVAAARAYEARLGRRADAHLAVTAAMAAQLRRPPYRLPPAAPLAVLHDRPAQIFQPAAGPFPPAGRARELAAMLGGGGAGGGGGGGEEEATALDRLLAHPQTKILVSSTSWTPDEDFGLLLDALVQYVREVPFVSAGGAAAAADAADQRPPILAVITGKGPQRAHYEQAVAARAAAGALPAGEVAVCTAFLPMAAYARLLALADLGVCLHTSSSGVDLPMKIVDMFGAGLPVAAFSAYASFGELVHEGANGRGFATAPALAALLARLLAPAGAGAAELARLRDGARLESRRRWADEWERVVAPLLDLEGERKTQ